jgi:DNA-binding protein
MNFRDTIGFGKDAAATGAVSAAKSIMAYVKQIVTQMLTGAGTSQIAATTEDLNQAASTYDLLTGTTQPVILEALTIKMPTGAAGGALTSISIQTDDATPGVIISSTLGAVANLTSEADIGWSGEMRIDVGTKIQLTIAGGAHGSEYITKISATYRAVVAGGTLA